MSTLERIYCVCGEHLSQGATEDERDDFRRDHKDHGGIRFKMFGYKKRR